MAATTATAAAVVVAWLGEWFRRAPLHLCLYAMQQQHTACHHAPERLRRTVVEVVEKEEDGGGHALVVTLMPDERCIYCTRHAIFPERRAVQLADAVRNVAAEHGYATTDPRDTHHPFGMVHVALEDCTLWMQSGATCKPKRALLDTTGRPDLVSRVIHASNHGLHGHGLGLFYHVERRHVGATHALAGVLPVAYLPELVWSYATATDATFL